MFLCPLLRPFTVAGTHRLGVSVLSAWTLSGAPLSVQELWPRFMKAAGKECVLDQGIPKSSSEYLLVGHAHSPEPVPHLAVSVELGGRQKVVNVVGDRVWQRGVPSTPEPFTTMPLSWERSFGGEGFAENPVGRGFVRGDAEGAPLPNLECPRRMIRSPSDRPEPAGFGPFGFDWPQRNKGLGTYDARWFENEFPGFASDIDWRVHNVAPLDQRFEHPFAPGERVVLHNLVEGRPRVELSLPRVMARCFTYRDEERRDLAEVPLALRTLWLVPDEDMIVLVFHGAQTIASMLGTEIAGLLLALDGAEHSRDVAHFAQVLSKRLDPTLGAAEMLDDAPLMPEGMQFPGFEARAQDPTLPERGGALEANLYAGAELRRQEALAAFAEAGFEGGEELFPPMAPPEPSKKPLTEQIQEALALGEEKRKEAEAKMAALREEAIEELKAAGFDPSFLDSKEQAGPPAMILASEQRAMLEEVVHEARAAGQPLLPFEAQLADPAFHRELAEKEAMGREAYRMSAHLSEGDPPIDLDRMTAQRERVEQAIRNRTSLAQADLTGADLADLDLSSMDLSGAWLEGANLTRANLTGARLDGAVLAKSNLGEAALAGTSLRKANLGRARLTWTRIDGCDLEEAILAHADLRVARVERSNLRGADLSNVRVAHDTLFSGSDLSGVTFLSMSLEGMTFEACALDEANFIEACVDRVSFPRCRMDKVVFVGCSGVESRFPEARLENARFVSKCRFDRADFRGAFLPRSTLRGSALESASFEGAELSDADLSQCALRGARFYRAVMKRALATEADLREADLRGANLMFAVLQGADLRAANLKGSNLFSADLALVHADRATSLEGALVTRVRHRPLRQKESV